MCGLRRGSVWFCLTAALASAAMPPKAAIAAQSPSAPAISFINSELDHELQDRFEGESTQTMQQQDPQTQPSTAPEVIVDPLPPGFWSGLITLGLGVALLGSAKIRRKLR